jgi:RNA polymerase sigma factor (sigma-70 family)
VGVYYTRMGDVGKGAAVDAATGLGFEAFFRAEYPRLFEAMVLVTGNRTEAEDIAQEAMTRVYERWDRVRIATSPAAYVFTTAFNLNRKRLRRLAVRRLRDDPREGLPSEKTEQIDLARDVLRALQVLPREQREAIVLIVWLDLDAAAAGRVLGIAPSSVRGRVHRARATLRALLGDPTDG